MTTDQVVAALASEGYSSDNIRTVIDAFADIPWRQGQGWTLQEVGVLRRQLGDPDTVPDLRFDTDTWAADLGYIIQRTTGDKVTLDADELRQIAADLLDPAPGDWMPEAATARLNVHGEVPGRYELDYTVTRWAGDLHEAISRGTDGGLQLDRQDLQVAANLLLHAQEGDWIPQAAQLRTQAVGK